MNQDEALEQWIEDDMRNVPCAMPVDEAGEYMCRAAWYAAVKHTLEHVAEELRRQHGDCDLEDCAAFVLKMKP